MRICRSFVSAVSLLALVIVGSTLGCETGPGLNEPASDVEPDVAPSPDATIDPSEYCEETVAGFCAFYVRCGRMNVDTEEECRDLFLESCNSKYERRYRDLVESGFLTLDAAGVEQCDAHLRTVDCEEQVLDLDGPCSEMWTGTVDVGGACGFDIETFVCGEGSACVLGLDLCGTCRPVAAVGESCAGDPTCDNDATCVDGVCVARAQPGESCAQGERCTLGAFCDADVCRGPAYSFAGGVCDQRRRCPYGTACVSGRCAVEARHGEGCGVSGCATGYCDADGICTPPQENGSVCADGSQCAGGICNDGICEGLPSVCLSTD